MAAGLVGWLTACVTMFFLRPGDAETLKLTALVAVGLFFQPADLLDLWFQSQNQNWRAVLPRVLSFMLVSGLRVGLILVDAPLWTFAAAYLVESVLALGFLAFSYHRFPTSGPWHWQFDTAKNLMIQAWPLFISGLSIIVYMRIDQILLRSLSSERELGLYSAILPFSQAWHFIPATVCASATPLLVQLHAHDPVAFKRRVADLFSFMFWCSVLICVAMLFAARPLVAWLLGEKYEGSGPVLALHVFSNIPVFMGMTQSRYLSIVGNTRVILVQTLCGMAASIALNLLLIPRFGAMGAAASGVGAYFISAVFCNAVLEPKLFIMQMMSWKRNYA
jgi:PST family polysaccharide transporter